MTYTTDHRIRGRKLMERRLRFMEAHPLCCVCEQLGRVRVWTELDHIIALAHGGEDTEDNLQGLCDEHHREKTNRDLGYHVKVQVGADGYPVGG